MGDLKYRIWDKEYKCFIDENNGLLMKMTIAESNATDIFCIEYYGENEIVKYSGVSDDKGDEIYAINGNRRAIKLV